MPGCPSLRSLLLALLFLLLAGCAVNPVTGEREFQLISEQGEVELGEENYAPLRQMQGGDYPLQPELIEYVQDVGQRVARESDRPDLPYEFTVIHSDVPNAWALPGGKIAINRGLLVSFESEAELAAVLAHEVAHAAARHSAQQMERQLIIQAGVIAVAAAGSDSQYADAIVGSATVGAGLIAQRYSRGAELEADRYGTRYMHEAGYNPMGAVRLMERFVALSENNRQGWLDGLFASHPPSQERVEANRRLANRLGTDGEWGRDAFMAATRELRRNEPAYETAAQAREHLNDGALGEALELARQARQTIPDEPRFIALVGHVHRGAKRPEQALTAYREALEREPAYFQHHLMVGLVEAKLGNDEAARPALKRSIERLPTAPAHLNLGHIERRAENREAAIAHYRVAAQSESPAGQEARQTLQEMGAASAGN